jgi:hypothetical protein
MVMVIPKYWSTKAGFLKKRGQTRNSRYEVEMRFSVDILPPFLLLINL